MIEQIYNLKPNSIYDVVDKSFFIEKDMNYDYLPPNCFDYYEIYYALSKYYQPKSILEIGVRYGYSLYSMVCGSDVIENVAGYDLEETLNGYHLPNNLNYHNKSKFEIVQENFDLFCNKKINLNLKYVNTQKINELNDYYDLIHIDGDHSIEGKLHDLEITKNKCKVVIIDDYALHSNVRQGVDIFLNNNQNSFKNVYFVNSRNLINNHCIIEY